MTTVLKLGGSVITHKDEPETVDRETLGMLAEAVAGHGGGDLVVVHGAGSFGHHYADAHGVTTTDGTTDAVAVREIHGAMKRLNGAVLDALAAREVPAVPVHPLSVARRDASGELTHPLAAVETLLGEDFLPVLHGDAIAHSGRGATILSGDEVVVELARGLAADRVGLCSAVPGVLDDEGSVVDRIESFEAVAGYLGGSEATDVTGGMAGKVRRLLALDAPAHVFGADRTGAFLDGAEPGTRIG
ncbi:MAG: isopentenyl phosphate kinase [Haloarculaceae archaeon]